MYTLTFLFERSLKRQDIHQPELINRLRGYLAEVLNMATMVELSHAGAEHAVYAKTFTDIEDSMQYQCAVENHCDVLLTINVNDFKHANDKQIEQIAAYPAAGGCGVGGACDGCGMKQCPDCPSANLT